jgi:hypothetical protein
VPVPPTFRVATTNIYINSFRGLHLPLLALQTSSANHLAPHLYDMQRKRTRKLGVQSLVLIWVSPPRPVAARKNLTPCSRPFLGTTNSAVAIMEGQTAKIIENSEGRRCNPPQLFYPSNSYRCSHDTLGCRLCSRWRAFSWCICQAPSSCQPREHPVRHKAVNRTQVHRRRGPA